MKDEALRLALEALEEIHVGNMTPMAEANWNKAITAIKQALEQPEPEPVVWRNAALRVGEDLCSVGPFGYYDMTAEQWLDWALSVVTVHAPPPKREWQGLTHEEIDEIYFKSSLEVDSRCEDIYDFVRAIEAAHGIKGDA